MQVTELKADGLQREYKVVLDADAMKQRITTRLETLGKNVKIPGFRPGKIPQSVLQQRYGKSVRDEVLEAAVNDTTRDVIKDKEIRPALPPKTEDLNFEDGKPLEYILKVELFPEVPEVDFGTITLERPVFEVAEADTTEALERIADDRTEPGEKRHRTRF